jgi:tRNA U38,U39,U40 pseudouridine synthase TruA
LSETDFMGHTTAYAYNGGGIAASFRCTSRTDAGGHATTYVCDNRYWKQTKKYLATDDSHRWSQEVSLSLTAVCEKSNWVLHAFVVMSNHYHLALATPDVNLSAVMPAL